MMRKERRNDTFVPGENVEEILRVNQVFSIYAAHKGLQTCSYP